MCMYMVFFSFDDMYFTFITEKFTFSLKPKQMILILTVKVLRIISVICRQRAISVQLSAFLFLDNAHFMTSSIHL